MTAVENPAEAPVAPGRISRLLANPAVRIIVPLVIVAITFYVLHELSAKVSWSAVKADVAASSWTSIALAIAAMAISFLALSLYDVLAVRSIATGQVPDRIAAFAGGSGTAISNLLGFSYLTGTAVRYRIYASLGVDLARVAGIIAISWIAFWLGLILILGLLFLAHPVGLSQVLPLDGTLEIAIGAALLVGLALLVLWLSRAPRSFWAEGFRVPLPGGRLALSLMGVAVIDLMGAAMTLYFLLPADLADNFVYFFVIYMGATALGILSHSPGGLGVFEATLIAGLGAAGRPDMLAALLLYRVIYSVLPFAVAVVALAVTWAVTRRGAIATTSNWAYRLIRPLVPIAAAGIALLAGSILLISGNLPGETARFGVLRDIIPLQFVEASHLAGSVAGLLLIVVARGLYRKLHRAWLIAMGLMIVGFVASIAKGLDWEEALGMLISLGVLGAFRSAFYRVEAVSVFRLNATWLVSILALLAAIFWIGFFAYSHVEYRDALWWQFAFDGDASRFLRASVVVALILFGITLNSLLYRRSGIKDSHEIPDVVRQLIAQSEDTEAQLDLLGDKAFLISEDNRAFIAYCDTGGSLITKGEPVGEEAAGRKLIWQLREMADKAGKRCAFYAVSPKYLATYLDLGLSILKIGEVARVNLQGFTLDGSSKKKFRGARSRAGRDGYEFAIIPKAEVPTVLDQLRGISDRWMQEKQGEEKGFSLGYFDDTYLSNFDHAVLRHVETGRIVAFANLFQGANKHELSLDLMRYDPEGPKIAMDALFAELMLWGAAEGFHWFSLGAAPFSGIENHQLSSLWNRIGGFIYEHGEQVYHFEGLRSFKEKFDPVWTPNYLASPGGLAAPRVLYEVNVLISGGIKGLVG
ncbi:bifunctional lysylphosphatidylglycerol flippase/synthetase MprF [Sedimentitalea todarodis]|uniref:Bifunctional lysylphosphatidylglycerol flippase/synthetase MprF n=1 Tax=Sedimentitalea todarodis TaxID=1631240 RepID=A0ABU3VEG9_9RHOB|nr:bifunctional lysylphosphatidylglycerol flippase/synthetase MprF [Sedimentitalea todarodis]MDU9004581.1 bifunctional lysylphosphatidylglycerol flippase/synthetase MprF [Sedimentitalea todarodis]